MEFKKNNLNETNNKMKVKINKIYDFIKATPEFKNLIKKYKKERKKALNILKNGNVEFFEIEKQKVINKETNEEYLYNEIKSHQKINEEIKNLHGAKALKNINSYKDIKTIEKRNSTIKIKKRKFFDNKKLNHNFVSDSDLMGNKIIPLPLIFPNRIDDLRSKLLPFINHHSVKNYDLPIKRNKIRKKHDIKFLSCLSNNEIIQSKSLVKYIHSLENLKDEYSRKSRKLKKELSDL